MKYKVRVIETLERVVEIEAESREEACNKAENMWFQGEIALVSPDHTVDHEIYIG